MKVSYVHTNPFSNPFVFDISRTNIQISASTVAFSDRFYHTSTHARILKAHSNSHSMSGSSI
jgi:hypothetical protein